MYRFNGPSSNITTNERALPFSIDLFPVPGCDAFALRFNLDESSEVVVELDSTDGRIDRRDTRGLKHRGMHRETPDLRGLPEGNYLVRIRAGAHNVTRLFRRLCR